VNARMRADVTKAAKRRRRRASPARSAELGPTPEQRAKYDYERVNVAEIDPVEQPIGEAPRNVTQWPLDRYLKRKNITGRQWLAGDTLRTAWERSGMSPHVTARYDGPSVGRGDPAFLVPVSHAAAQARLAYRSAIQAVGQRLSPVLVAVCCEGNGVRELGEGKGWRGATASAAGMMALQIALDALADHYNLRPEG
jgi:hypothetical protein